MQALTDTLLPIVNTINGYLSDYILVFLLMGAGLYFSFKTKFVQVRCFGEGMKRVFGNLTLSGKKHESGMSSFQALATAIAAQVGTGNIVGASGAILTGGPGAIFWMWIIAFFGMATIYAEAVLAQKTRVKNEDGQYLGGPVYYIRTAFQGSLGKFLAAFFDHPLSGYIDPFLPHRTLIISRQSGTFHDHLLVLLWQNIPGTSGHHLKLWYPHMLIYHKIRSYLVMPHGIIGRPVIFCSIDLSGL